MLPPPPTPTLFPYTTLFRSLPSRDGHRRRGATCHEIAASRRPSRAPCVSSRAWRRDRDRAWLWSDRKSTRLNSSHLGISYAVFCLKKKKKRQNIKIAEQ